MFVSKHNIFSLFILELLLKQMYTRKRTLVLRLPYKVL